MACGGTCGGSAPAEKTGGKQPGDVASSKADASAAHACKCVCVCGTPTGVSAPELSDVTIPQPSVNLAAPGPTAEEIEERDLKSRVFVPDAALPAFDALWTQYDPPGPTIDAAPSGAPGGAGIHAPIPGKPPLNLTELYEDRNRPLSSAFALGSGSADVEAPGPLPVVNATWPVVAPPPLPMFRSNAQVLFTPNRPVLDARAAPVMPVEPLVSWSPGGSVQGESSAATAVMEAPPEAIGARAYGGSIAPPDSTRFPSPEFVGPSTLSPPHAGSFALGGPDSPPGAGIGARAFPVPGSDGTPRWTPSEDAAKRTLDSDLDAHREPLPVRVPFGSIEGDLGPGLEPVPRGVKTPGGLLSFRGAVTPPLHPDEGSGLSRAALGTMVPLSASLGPMRGKLLGASPVALPFVGGRVVTGEIGSYAPPAVLGPARTKSLLTSAFVQPPSGPWDLSTATKDAPQLQGYEAATIRQPPAFPGAEVESAAPESGTDIYAATGRPTVPGLDALKAAMKGGVPVDQWRTPKPVMPGGPTGGGGRGGGIGALAADAEPLLDALAASRRDVNRLTDKLDLARAMSSDQSPGLGTVAAVEENLSEVHMGIGTVAVGDYENPSEAGPDVAQTEQELQDALARAAALELALAQKGAHAGSQWEDRVDEQLEREKEARDREFEREENKRKTRPNYDQYAVGAAATVTAQEVRDQATDIHNAANRLEGKADADKVAAASGAADAAKKASKEAEKAAKKAKDAAKFGTKQEAEAAAEKAQKAADAADSAAAAAAEALGEAVKSAEQNEPKKDDKPKGDACAGGGSCGESGGGGGGGRGGSYKPTRPRVETDIPGVHPGCGNPLLVCKIPKIACPDPDTQYWVCTTAKGDPIPASKGVKGKGLMPKGGSRTMTIDQIVMAYLDATRNVIPPTVAPADGPAEEPPSDAQPPEPPAKQPGDGAPQASEEELVAQGEKTLRALKPLIDKERKELAIALGGVQQILLKLVSDRKPTAGEMKALERKLVEAAIHEEALGMLLDVDTGVRLALAKGLSGGGAEREEAYLAVRKAEWAAPDAVKGFLKEAKGAIGATRVPDEVADAILLEQRRGIEMLVEERYQQAIRLASNRMPDRDSIRGQVLDEIERGGAPGLFSMAVGAFGEAADTVLGRPIRAGILAGRDAIHGSPSTRSAWARAGEVGGLTRELVAGLEGHEGWQVFAAIVGATAEATGDVGTVLGSPKAIANVAKGLKAAAGAKNLSAAQRVALMFAEAPAGVGVGASVEGGLSLPSRAARKVLRPGLEWVADLELPFRVPKTLSVRLSRTLATATKGYASVDESLIANLLRRVPGLSQIELEQGHTFIQQRWFRAGGPTAWYSAEDAARLGLQSVGNAGWNLMPLPRALNQALGRSPWGAAAFGVGIAGGAGLTLYGAYKAGKWAGDQIAGVGNGE